MAGQEAVFFWDTETFSSLKLPDVGSERYFEDARTVIQLICYALDDGPVHYWKAGDPVEPLLAAARRAKLWVSHNIAFDRTGWNLKLTPLGLPLIPIDNCVDTAALCRAIAIPAKLEAAAKVLLPPEFHKAGKDVALKMGTPRLPWPGEDPAGLYMLDDAEIWAEYIAYCKQDVAAMRALFRVLPPLIKTEHEVWVCDQIVNGRGVYLDGQAIECGCELIGLEREDANARLLALTNGEINSTDKGAKIKDWINAHIDPPKLENYRAETLQKLLQRENLTAGVRAVAETRLKAAQAAAAKPIRMRAWRCENGRAKHTLVYHGAMPGRWAGRGPQFQNLKKEGNDLTNKLIAVLSGEPTRFAA